MKIYLAGPYSARKMLKGYAEEAARVGYTVTASWLDGTHEINDGSLGPAKAFTDTEAASWAAADLADVDKADMLVAFTSDAVGGGGTSGGRHIETGYAIAKGKPVILVGEPENVFHRLGGKVTVCADWHQALILLAACLVADRRPQAVAR